MLAQQCQRLQERLDSELQERLDSERTARGEERRATERHAKVRHENERHASPEALPSPKLQSTVAAQRQTEATQDGEESARVPGQRPSPFSRHLTRTASRHLLEEDEPEVMQHETVIEKLTRERDEAQAELAAYVLEEVARRRQEEQAASTDGVDVGVRLAVRRSFPLVQACRVHGRGSESACPRWRVSDDCLCVSNGKQELERAYKIKDANEKSLEDTVRRLRVRETKDRLAVAQRAREREESIARERSAWRAPVRDLISMLSDVSLLAAEVRVGVSEEERRRRAAPVPRGSRQPASMLAIEAPAAAEDERPGTGGGGHRGGEGHGGATNAWLVKVWQEGASAPEQEVGVLREQVEGQTRQLDMVRTKLAARDALHEQLQSEHATLRKEFLALQLELKIAHESCWAAEEELMAMRAKLSARCLLPRQCVCARGERRLGCLCVCVPVCVYIHTYIHTYMRARTHTHAHMHMHTHGQMQVLKMKNEALRNKLKEKCDPVG